MSKYFQIVDAEPLEDKAPSKDEFACGAGWTIIQQDEDFRLDYISGELQGSEKSLKISKADAEKMKSGDLDLDALLIAYNAS